MSKLLLSTSMVVALLAIGVETAKAEEPLIPAPEFNLPQQEATENVDKVTTNTDVVTSETELTQVMQDLDSDHKELQTALDALQKEPDPEKQGEIFKNEVEPKMQAVEESTQKATTEFQTAEKQLSTSTTGAESEEEQMAKEEKEPETPQEQQAINKLDSESVQEIAKNADNQANEITATLNIAEEIQGNLEVAKVPASDERVVKLKEAINQLKLALDSLYPGVAQKKGVSAKK